MEDTSNMLVGVVEGFYGRPWKPEQRRELFHLMQCWSMNAYLYAPKDDRKHRADWREPYVTEELSTRQWQRRKLVLWSKASDSQRC